MTAHDDDTRLEALRKLTWSTRATQAELAGEPPAFPSLSAANSVETWYDDWRARLTRNLSRRSDGRWDPLTRTHPPER
jgi:hypothetical protein